MTKTYLSTYFTLEDLTHSNHALTNNLPNKPNEKQLFNLKMLCTNVLNPLRCLYGHPIYVNSAFRTKEINAAVGGEPDSQHLKGQAADITTRDADQNRILFGFILAHPDIVKFDQVILYHKNAKGCPVFIHISWSENPRSVWTDLKNK